MNFNTRSLQELYVRFHTEAENHPELEDAAREWFRKMEQGDPEALKILNFCKEITLKDVKKVYERLHVHFDDWSGESFYTDKMPAVLDDLRKNTSQSFPKAPKWWTSPNTICLPACS